MTDIDSGQSVIANKLILHSGNEFCFENAQCGLWQWGSTMFALCFLLFQSIFVHCDCNLPQIRSSSGFSELLQCHVFDQNLVGAWKVLGPCIPQPGRAYRVWCLPVKISDGARSDGDVIVSAIS